MRKENVFLVTARVGGGPEASVGEGGLEQRVMCATDELALHAFLAASFPDLAVVGAVSLAGLETTIAQIKQALGGVGPIPVFIDPAMPG